MNSWISLETGDFAAWGIPLLIFLGRICDVTFGTIRIILVGRGKRFPATILGFFEILIWLLAISQIMQNLTNITNYIAYAAGFAVGTFVGMTIERWLAIGTLVVRIVIPREAEDLIVYLIAKGFEVTRLNAEGALAPVTVILTVVKSRKLPRLLEIINKYYPRAFYTVEDVRLVHEPVNPATPISFRKRLLHPFYWLRKSK